MITYKGFDIEPTDGFFTITHNTGAWDGVTPASKTTIEACKEWINDYWATTHKLVRVEAGQPFIVVCYDCGKHVNSNYLWADLKGESYKAYYCDDCKNKIYNYRETASKTFGRL